MFKLSRTSPFPLLALGLTSIVCAAPACAQAPPADWSFGVSGDSRNCGDFVMPAIATSVKQEDDAFYWHLGDFRLGSGTDEDIKFMNPAAAQWSRPEYLTHEWDDFLAHQIAPFAPTPVFIGRGNHENGEPVTRDNYIDKFHDLLTRPEIEAQRKADGAGAGPVAPWYHWVKDGIDFITLDNSSRDEFSDAQLKWLRGVIDRDLAPGSGVRTLVAGMHEALPHSTGAEHAMDDWDLGLHSGELVYTWFYDAQAAGKHVYLIASHSHYYSLNIYNTPYWKERMGSIVPGYIIGTAGAHRYNLPAKPGAGAKTHIYGYLRGTVHGDGTITFALHELSREDLAKVKWPEEQPKDLDWCYDHNADE